MQARLLTAVQTCNAAVHVAADAHDIRHMSGIRKHRIVRAARDNVIATNDVLRGMLRPSDPTTVSTPGMAQLAIVVPVLGSICKDCPLLKCSRKDLPAQCEPLRVLSSAGETKDEEPPVYEYIHSVK